MRLFLPLLALLSVQHLSASNLNTCKSCHPAIYGEFQNSFHKKSTIKKDRVHKAVWDKHPAKGKGDYNCAKCHSPVEAGKSQEHQGITCISCHTIKDIKQHPKSNINILETKPKTFYSAQKGMEDKKVIYHEKTSWFGLVKDTVGSPYHDIDYTNKNFYTGKMCMGCHSHKQNGKKFSVCVTDMQGAQNKKANCITCHMPQVQGTSTTIRKTKTHAFHGFAGVRNAPKMLSKYIDLDYKKTTSGFAITVHNHAPHDLLTHPLRVVQLKTILKKDGKSTELKTHTFARILAHEGKPAMPWVATGLLKNNMIKANEERTVAFENTLVSGDELEVVLGYYIVNPKAVKKLGLENEKDLSSFKILKNSYFKIK